MFFHVLWRQEQIAKSLKEENTQLRVLLRALESRMDYLAQICLAEKGQLPDSSIRDTRARADMAGIDPLLHLSFDEPGHPVNASALCLDKCLELTSSLAVLRIYSAILGCLSKKSIL